MTKQDKRHALVTGGSRGIGHAIAHGLSAAGVRVTVLGRDESALGRAVAEGVAGQFVVADTTKQNATETAVARAAATFGPIDILVANAGGAESAPFMKTSDAIFHHLFDLNVMGTVHAIRAVLPGMTKRNFGRVVAVASTAGLKGYPYVTAYAAAKHAVVGLIRSLAIEVINAGVTVNAVCPGYTDTELVRRSVADTAKRSGRSESEILATMLKNVPLARLLTPQEVAAAVLYLCSPEASAITGTALPIAGAEL